MPKRVNSRIGRTFAASRDLTVAKIARETIDNDEDLAAAERANPRIFHALTASLERVGATRTTIPIRDLVRPELTPRVPPRRIPEIRPGTILQPRPGIKFPPLELPDIDDEDDEAAQIDLEIQLLLNAIPIAHENHVITSEYHNALRDALFALARRAGVRAGTDSELQILTFAPEFKALERQIENRTVSAWETVFDRAFVPHNIDGENNTTVGGAFAVRLPDDAMIQSMIVRAVRIGAQTSQPPDPKAFQISLRRAKLDSQRPLIADLIKFDLSREIGTIKKAGTVAASFPDDDSDQETRDKRIADLSFVKNDSHRYFIVAEWEGNQNSAKFEIGSAQILCRL